MPRTYRKAKRAEAQEETREKILGATVALHLEKGVATTSYSDVAERAGVGVATVYRHFPTMGSLVEACGALIWQTIEPPQPKHAQTLFAGHRSRAARLQELVRELDAFYVRATAPLWSAVRDHDRVPELALFLKDVRAGVTALIAAAMDEDAQAHPVRIAAAVADFTVWLALSGAGAGPEERTRLMLAMIEAVLSAPPPGAGQSRRAGRSTTRR